MITFAALAASLTSQVVVDRYAEGGWTLRIVRDAFAARTSCALESRRPRMVYRAGVVGFVFAPSRSVGDAQYRVDGGQPIRFSDRLPNLTAAGVPLDQGGLDNPSAGIVWISTGELTRARQVAIRPQAGRPIRQFALGGFETLRAAARRLGCASDADFAG